MKRIVWIVIAVVSSVGVYFTIRYGLRPKPIPILNPTHFENPEQIGAVIYRRLRQNLRSERLLVIGSKKDLAQSAEIWNGFLKTAMADKMKIDQFYQWPNLALPTSASQLQTVYLQEADLANEDLLKNIHQSIQRGSVVIVHVPTEEATHLVKGSLTRKLEQLPNIPVFSISIVPWSINAEGTKALAEECTQPDSPDRLDLQLQCAVYRLSRKFLRKKLDPSKSWAAAERHGLKEYLLFINSP